MFQLLTIPPYYWHYITILQSAQEARVWQSIVVARRNMHLATSV